jgi:hypothetical protein
MLISNTSQIQAKYTDCLLLNKYDLVTERELDSVLDHLYELNDETPMIRVSKSSPLKPELVFGLDTKLFEKGSEETADWELLGVDGKKETHMEEIETRSVWRGGSKPGKGKKREALGDGHGHEHAKGEKCDCDGETAGEDESVAGDEAPVSLKLLEAELKKLPFEIYRGESRQCPVLVLLPIFGCPFAVKGFLRLEDASDSSVHIHALNWAFGRFELTKMTSLDALTELKGVSVRLTLMGARGEVLKRARKLAQAIDSECA